MIYKALYEGTLDRMNGLTVRDVRIGLNYTAVENSAGGLGVAMVFRRELPEKCTNFSSAGTLVGQNLEDVARYYLSENGNILHSSVGLACINSVASHGEGDVLKGDILDALKIEKGENVLMVGFFAPVAKRLNEMECNLFVYDNNKKVPGEEMPPLEQVAGSCTVAIITATSLVNKTLHHIIEKTENARVRALLGPSTPLFPELFEDSGIHLLSGMKFRDNEKVKQIVSQAGGTMIFKDYADKINLTVKKAISACS